ncbi:MAG: GTP 3',8-cyclase MoaA [Hydrotalea sp.]|nr:GTP 3',8-cyclase MoaA [Hydrotalea sp.]
MTESVLSKESRGVATDITNAPSAQPNLRDGFGRTISYLRLSVTDRCDLRCVYCMPAKMKFLPKKEILELEELLVIAKQFIALGVKKIRLTGGEPLVRKNILWLIEKLGQELLPTGTGGTGDSGLQGLQELTLTTNGTQLAGMAEQIFAAGVRRVNVSLDSLKPDVFARITRGGNLAAVQMALKTAQVVGLKIKINMVVMRGVNDAEVHDMIGWCGAQGYDLTFIEIMPMGNIGEEVAGNSENAGEENWSVRQSQYMPLSLVRADIMARWRLSKSDYKSGGPANYYRCEETGQKIGFITPLTNHFCATCNRVRLTTSGKLFLCLGKDNMVDLKLALRTGGAEKLRATIIDAMTQKPLSHDFVIGRNDNNPSQKRAMVETGG